MSGSTHIYIIEDKQKIQDILEQSSVGLLMLFIHVIETDKRLKFPLLLKMYATMQEKGRGKKVNYNVKSESARLHHSGTGFGRLRSGQYILDGMFE